MLNQLLEIGVQQTRFSNSSIVQATLYCRSKRFTTKCMRATEERRRICQNSKLEGSSCSWSSDRGWTTTILNQLLCTTPLRLDASVSSSHASFPVIWVEWSVTLVRVSHLEREKTKDAVSKMKLQRFVVKHTQKFYFAKKQEKNVCSLQRFARVIWQIIYNYTTNSSRQESFTILKTIPAKTTLHCGSGPEGWTHTPSARKAPTQFCLQTSSQMIWDSWFFS